MRYVYMVTDGAGCWPMERLKEALATGRRIELRWRPESKRPENHESSRDRVDETIARGTVYISWRETGWRVDDATIGIVDTYAGGDRLKTTEDARATVHEVLSTAGLRMEADPAYGSRR